MRGERRWKIGLLFGVMALLGAVVGSVSVAQSTPVRAQVGVLRLHLDNDGKYFRFDTPTATPGAVQSINGSCPVTSLTEPQWTDLTGGTTSFSLNQVGLKDNGLGIKYLNCGRVDASNWALRIKLGSAIDGPGIGVDLAELDLQGWGNVTAVADLYLNGTKVDSVTKAISGSGTRARMVIDRTGKTLFDEIRLHPKKLLTSVALRGGGAGSPPPGTLGSSLGTNDTLFRVVSETDLTVTKSAVHTPISAGENAEFLITVKNNGSDALSNIGISDALPPELSWSESANECSIDGQSQLLTCTIPTLAKEASYSVTVSAQATNAGTVTNLDATVTANNAVYHSGPAVVNVVPGAPLLTFDPPNGAQPTLTKFGECISSPNCTSGGVKVYAEDQYHNPVSDSITMSIGTDPTSTGPSDHATLDGTLTQPTVGGVATFPDLTIDRTSSGFQLLATLGSATALSDEFAISNTDDSCTDDCTATFDNGTSTVSAPAGTTLIIETNQLDCTGVETPIAGTVTIIPSDPNTTDGVPITFHDVIGFPIEGPYPFCKTPHTDQTVPACDDLSPGQGLNEPGGTVACVEESVALHGVNPPTLESTLWISGSDPIGKH